MWKFWKRAKPHNVVEPTTPAELFVQQFQREYEAQWQIASPAFEEKRTTRNDSDPFELWRDLMGQTTQRYFADSSQNLSGSFSTPPDYGTQIERFVRSEEQGDAAYVLNRVEGPLEKFHEYVLQRRNDGFKILNIFTYYDDPVQPFVDGMTIAERVRGCSPDAPLGPLAESDAALDENRTFTNHEVRYGSGETAQTRVESIGTLVTSSGMLTVWDFGWDNDDARPLARMVEPGTYPIDRVTVAKRNAAVRVRLSEEIPVSWHPAALVNDPGEVVPVDAGCICIVDYPAYAAMTPRDKAIAEESINKVPRPAAIQFSPGASDTGFACDSGNGDGYYPAYWGLDAHGNLAQLVVDFIMLPAEEDGPAL